MKEEKKNKIVFNEEIDSAISGYALAITFIGIGIFLFNNLDYLGNKIVSYIVLVIVSFIGVIGTTVELSKSKTIKGFDDIGLGLFFLFFWFVIYAFFDIIVLNILALFCLLLGGFSFISGVLKIMVSIFYNTSEEDNKIKNVTINFFKVLPTIASFVLVIFNIIKIALEL